MSLSYSFCSSYAACARASRRSAHGTTQQGNALGAGCCPGGGSACVAGLAAIISRRRQCFASFRGNAGSCRQITEPPSRAHAAQRATHRTARASTAQCSLHGSDASNRHPTSTIHSTKSAQLTARASAAQCSLHGTGVPDCHPTATTATTHAQRATHRTWKTPAWLKLPSAITMQFSAAHGGLAGLFGLLGYLSEGAFGHHDAVLCGTWGITVIVQAIGRNHIE